MSTNSTITVITKKGEEAKRIYCHWDGYPSWVGAYLLQYYNTFEKAKALVELGDISSLRERLAPEPGEQHSFEDPLEDVTIFYGRDRGEEGTEPKVDHPDVIFFPTTSVLEEYNYMHDGEKWLIKKQKGKQWQELTRNMCDLSEQSDEDNLLEHAIVNQLETDLEAQEYDSLSELINSLLKDENSKKQLIEYLSDSAKENWLEGRTKIRF